MGDMHMAALRYMWHQFRSMPWLCDSLVLGVTVAATSSTSALAFSSALMRFPKMSPSASTYSATTSALQQAIIDTACHECNALRIFNNPKWPVGETSTLLGFSTDTLITETLMSFVISFIIVTFSVFLVRELR